MIDGKPRIGDEVYIHGYIDEIRKDVVIIRNEGGYFGTSDKEMFYYEEDERGYGTMNEADRKTEPTISKMEQVDKDINVRSKDEPTWEQVKEYCNKRCLDIVDSAMRKQWYKDEPQTDCGDFANRLAYERGVKHAWEVAQKVFDSTVTFYEAEDVAKQIDKDINVRSKDKPTTQTETQNSNLTFKTLDYCDICDHKGCEECIANALDEHCIPSQFKKQIEDGCAKEYEELGLKELKELIKADRKDEPLTDCAWRYGDADTEASDH